MLTVKLFPSGRKYTIYWQQVIYASIPTIASKARITPTTHP